MYQQIFSCTAIWVSADAAWTNLSNIFLPRDGWRWWCTGLQDPDLSLTLHLPVGSFYQICSKFRHLFPVWVCSILHPSVPQQQLLSSMEGLANKRVVLGTELIVQIILLLVFCQIAKLPNRKRSENLYKTKTYFFLILTCCALQWLF